MKLVELLSMFNVIGIALMIISIFVIIKTDKSYVINKNLDNGDIKKEKGGKKEWE